jgi:uncharacterized membrane protein YhaH (DUF805 family)
MLERLYLSPRGRSSRKFYWIFGVLPFFVLGVLIGFLMSAFGLGQEVAFVASLATLWPCLAMQIKRWHDLDMSGWWALLTFLPLLNLLVVVVVGLIPGTPGANRFGPNPLNSKVVSARAL